MNRLLQTSKHANCLSPPFPYCLPSRMLAVRNAEGSRTRVHVGDPRQLQGLRTGMQVKVTGTWAAPGSSGGSGGIHAAMGVGSTVPRFQASAITSTGGGDIASPTVVTQRLSADGTVPAAGATPAAGPVAFTSTNRLAARNISVLVIPREQAAAPAERAGQAAFCPATGAGSHVLVAAAYAPSLLPPRHSAVSGRDASGAACPGTSLPSNTADKVRATVLQEANPSGVTVGSTYNKCSYGKSRLTAQNSLVADTLMLPCQGET